MEDNITLEISEVGEAESKEESKAESKAESNAESKAESKDSKELEVSFQIAEKARKLNEFILTKWKRSSFVASIQIVRVEKATLWFLNQRVVSLLPSSGTEAVIPRPKCGTLVVFYYR